MASNKTLDSLSNYNGIKTVWSQRSQSISGNTSVLRATITQYSTAWSYSNDTSTLTLKADGQTKTVTVPTWNWSGANSRSLGYVEFTIDHNTNGSKSASISHSWNQFPQSKSGTFSFDTIPRTSTFTIPSSFNVGSAFTVYITRASSSFTHVVTLDDGSTRLYSSGDITGTSDSVNVAANTLIARMSGVKSKTFTVKVATFNESTYIGSTSKTITANIPVSTFTAPTSFTMGNAFTVDVSRVGSLTHVVTLDDGSTRLYSSGNTIGTSDSVNVALSTLAKRSPNAMSKTFTVKVATFNESTYIGDTSKTITANVPANVKPKFDAVTVSENVSSVATLVGAYVQRKSRLNLAITGASGVYGSTIRSYKISGVGHSSSSSSTTTGVLSVSGNQTIKGIVTDSRGQTYEKSIVVNILSYTPPTLSNLSFRRTLPDKTEAPLGDNVTVRANVKVKSLIVNGVEKNSIKYHVQSARVGYSFADKANTTSTSLTKSYSDVWSGYSVDYSYNFRVRAGDVFGFAGWSVGVVPTGIVTQQWGSKTTSFGKMIDNTSYNVQVGTGGIQSDGPIVAHQGIRVLDTRDVISESQDLPGKAVSFEFKRNTSVGNPPVTATSTYSHIINVAGWSSHEGSGGFPSQISVGADGLAVRQATSATAWGSWRTLYHSGNRPIKYQHNVTVTNGTSEIMMFSFINWSEVPYTSMNLIASFLYATGHVNTQNILTATGIAVRSGANRFISGVFTPNGERLGYVYASSTGAIAASNTTGWTSAVIKDYVQSV